LSLALALGNADPKAVQALVGLSESADLTGAEAAAELAPRDEQARKRLRALTSHTTLLVRATAARLIARELHESDPLVKLLADASWQVRSAAAGAVLSVL
jgi:HEAT repeat protein